MDDAEFWRIIESGGAKALEDQDRQMTAVHKALAKLTPERLVEFREQYDRKISAAFTWDLWGAAFLMNGGCSDDGFHYFSSWLISRGKTVFEAAVKDPDSLSGIADSERDDCEFESLEYLPLEVYEELTGNEMPIVPIQRPRQPQGKEWDFDDQREVSRRLPKLNRVYRDGAR